MTTSIINPRSIYQALKHSPTYLISRLNHSFLYSKQEFSDFLKILIKSKMIEAI